jgi:hypothetical protein
MKGEGNIQSGIGFGIKLFSGKQSSGDESPSAVDHMNRNGINHIIDFQVNQEGRGGVVQATSENA